MSCNCASFPQIKTGLHNGRTSRLSTFYHILNHKNFIPKYLDNAHIDFTLTSRESRRILEKKASVNDFGRTGPSTEKYGYK